MREIDLRKEAPTRVTVLSYGATRTGKTRWASTWPRPLFLSDNTESGWTTIVHMNPDDFFEPNRKPRVWAIENATDMMQSLNDVEPLIKRGDVQTLVIDSLSYYNDLFLNYLISVMSSGGKAPDNRQVYQRLSQHLQNLRIKVHSLNINVVWICLEKPPGEDNPYGWPMISGQQAQKFPPGCDYIFYHRSFQVGPKEPLNYEIRTRKFGAFAAGGRDEGLLPDPLGFWQEVENGHEPVFYTDCTYRTFAEQLGMSTQPLPPPVQTAVKATTPKATTPTATKATSAAATKTATPVAAIKAAQPR